MQTAIVSILAGLIGVPLVNYLKSTLGWNGGRVKLLAGVVSGGLALILVALACVVPLELACVLPLTPDTVAAAISIAFSASQVFYAILPKF